MITKIIYLYNLHQTFRPRFCNLQPIAPLFNTQIMSRSIKNYLVNYSTLISTLQAHVKIGVNIDPLRIFLPAFMKYKGAILQNYAPLKKVPAGV